MPYLIYDESDNRIVIGSNNFIGVVHKDSGVSFGIYPNAEYIAHYLNDELDRRKSLKVGDIIVIDLPTQKRFETGKRIRKIRAIKENGYLAFLPDSKGKEHKERHISDECIIGKVTHVHNPY